jgi:hypothetical protein
MRGGSCPSPETPLLQLVLVLLIHVQEVHMNPVAYKIYT